MKKVISMLAILVMVAGLCTGCKDTDTGTDKPQPEVTKQSQDVEAKDWEPETAKETATTCPEGEHDHSEHEKDAHDENDGHDHSGHNH